MAQLLSGTRVYGNTSIDSQLIVGNVTPYQATSNTTGSLIITGGVGVQGNVYADGVYVTGNLVVGGTSITNTLTTANANISLLFAIDNYQNTIIQSIYSVANTDVTNVSITATTTSANGLYIPVITIAANGRVTAVSNTLIVGGGGSSSGYLNNSVIFANSTGYLSNTSNLQFFTSNNTFVINGTLAAVSKSFLINHPTKEGMKLRYGSLEGPENGVYVRGILNGTVIELPDYWIKLVDPETITVQLTPIGKYQNLYVEKIENNCVYVGQEGWFKNDINCFYNVYAERADIEKLVAEI